MEILTDAGVLARPRCRSSRRRVRKFPIVLEARQHAPHLLDARRIHPGVNNAGRLAAVGKHVTPWIDHERVAVRRAIAGMFTAHRGREDEARVLDRACLEERVPVRLAGDALERRGDREIPGAGPRERAIELWEAQVVAHRQAELAPGRIGDDRMRAGTIRGGLADRLAVGQHAIEHMDLVVGRDDPTVRIEEIGTVGDAVAVRAQRERSHEQPHTAFAGE